MKLDPSLRSSRLNNPKESQEWENEQPPVQIPNLNMEAVTKSNLRQVMLEDIIKGGPNFMSSSVSNKFGHQKIRVSTPENE